jgi:hypothetical protein
MSILLSAAAAEVVIATPAETPGALVQQSLRAGQDVLAMRFSSSYWIAVPGYLLFFIMLFVPTVYQGVKAGLLLLVLGIISLDALRRDYLALHPVVLLWTLFMATVGLAFMLLGLAHGAPGALRMGTVYVLWPLVYSVLITGAATEHILQGLHRVLVGASW